MFAPIAIENIAFPQSSSLSTLDSIPESFEAWNAYCSVPTSSTYTSSSVTTGRNGVYRYGMGPNDRILGVLEGGTSPYVWDTQTNTSSSVSFTTPGTIRNVLWDNVTNSWVVFGTNSLLKVDCDTLAVTTITNPSNYGTQYASSVVFGGKAYGLPLVSTTTNTGVAIWDLVANTATTSSVKVGGTGGFWGAVVTSVGSIYFSKEVGGTNNSIFEYWPSLDSGSLFGTMSGNTGYGLTNLPDGKVFTAGLGINNTAFIINPIDKTIQTLSSPGFGYQTGLCVGQNGHVYGIRSAASGTSAIWGFNPITQTGYQSQYFVQAATSGDRGFQDLFQLSDGRLVAMPGQNQNPNGLLYYWTYLSQPANNTFSSIGAVNPIMGNAKGT